MNEADEKRRRKLANAEFWIKVAVTDLVERGVHRNNCKLRGFRAALAMLRAALAALRKEEK